MSEKQTTPDHNLDSIIRSAQRLGIDLDETALEVWLTAITDSKQEGDVVFDNRIGVFGHKVSMLDFSSDDLAHFRKLGRLVEFQDIPGKVETARWPCPALPPNPRSRPIPGMRIILNGSMSWPIPRDQACQILAEIIQNKALETLSGLYYQLMEVRFGSFPVDVVIDGKNYPSRGIDQLDARTAPGRPYQMPHTHW